MKSEKEKVFQWNKNIEQIQRYEPQTETIIDDFLSLKEIIQNRDHLTNLHIEKAILLLFDEVEKLSRQRVRKNQSDK